MRSQFLIFILSFCLSSFALVPTSNEPLLSHNFNTIAQLTKKEARPIAVFIHTDWCRYCENMQHTTFRKKDIISTLNEEYYFISLDAEDKTPIEFAGKTYQFQPTGKNTGIHELAQALGTIDGKVSYPAFVILNERYEIVFQYQSFLNTQQMKLVLDKFQSLK